MTTQPRLLDLFCGGGGATRGYQLAGFHAVGVDLTRHGDYCGDEFHRANAMTFPLDGFDAIHASPPCKAFTPAGNGARAGATLFDVHDDLLTPTLERLAEVDVPWVVENVMDAPMPPGSVMLCGSSFGLAVRRHRLFASNVPLDGRPCNHTTDRRFQSLDWKARKLGRRATVVAVNGNLQGGEDTLELRRWAMGIDWMSNDTLTQAIPPAYTEHLGRQLMAHVRSAVAS